MLATGTQVKSVCQTQVLRGNGDAMVVSPLTVLCHLSRITLIRARNKVPGDSDGIGDLVDVDGPSESNQPSASPGS